MFTYFTDRDGKYQLGTLKESGFDPLSRTCEFMLKEEAHHMFVGTTGVDRVVERSAELIREHDTLDIGPRGGIPLDIIQNGTIVDEATWRAASHRWLPTSEDLAFVRSMMRPVYERGKIASWVAP